MAFLPSQAERLFLEVESAYGTINNTGGTASVGNSNACRHISCELTPLPELATRPDKHYILSPIAKQVVYRQASFSVKMALAGSGSAGVKPNCDPLLQAAFGQAGTVSAGVSVTYSLADLISSVSIWSFLSTAGAIQRCLAGGVVNSMTISFGPGFAEITFDGVGKWMVDSKSFASLSTALKCGLTAFPTQPSSPTFAGSAISGYKGSLTINGYAVSLESGTLKLMFDRELRKVFGSALGGVAVPGIRSVSLDAGIYMDGSSNEGTLLTDAILSNAQTTTTLVIGEDAGNIGTATLKNMVLQPPKLDDSGRSYVARLSGEASSSDGSSKDEVTLVLT